MSVASATIWKTVRAIHLSERATQTAHGALTILEWRDVKAWRAAAVDYRLAALLVAASAVPSAAVAARRRYATALNAAAGVCDELAATDTPGARGVLGAALELVSESMTGFVAELQEANTQP